MIKAGKSSAHEELVATADVFSRTFDGVRYGNPERGITPPPESIIPQANIVADIWEKYKKDVALIADPTSSSEEIHFATEEIGAINLSLLKEANNMVQLFEQEAQKKTEALIQFLFITLGLSLVVFALTMVILVKSLRPVGELVEATSRVKSGDMNVSLSSKRQDELGQLCVSFNEMIGTMRDSKEAIMQEKGKRFGGETKCCSPGSECRITTEVPV